MCSEKEQSHMLLMSAALVLTVEDMQKEKKNVTSLSFSMSTAVPDMGLAKMHR